MFQFDKLAVNERQAIQKACSFLFSPEKAANTHFLKNLRKSDIKTEFRKKAKMFHPDLVRTGKEELLLRRKERFLRIQHSYETLVAVFPDEQREAIRKNKRRLKKIIAVGGAKGGIGKSVFAANLGVILSNFGHKTVVADFDLGGANLHLYLGQTRVKNNINDYLNKKVTNLEDVLIKSQYGPLILGGDSSKLGAANIHYSKKIKLIRAVKEIDADYIVIDLGGDTSFNMIDFFNIADVKIVMTTCEPASYLDAYNFIKVALHRKLTRLFSDSKENMDHEDKSMEKMIRDMLMVSSSAKGPIDDLKKKVTAAFPGKRYSLNRLLNEYRPVLLINKTNATSEAADVAKRIREVSEKMLSIDVKVSAPVLFDKNTEESARNLVPVSVKYKDGYMIGRLKDIVNKTII